MSDRTARIAAAVGSASIGIILLATTTFAQAAPRSYDTIMVLSQASGLRVTVTVQGLLPVDQLGDLSTVSADARLDAGRSTALAALPDPGSLVRSLPGTVSGLAGVSGLPDYPAATRADYPTQTKSHVSIAPDAGLGVGQLDAAAQAQAADATAYLTSLDAPIGVLPFTVGSITATARSAHADADTFEATSTTSVNDLRLLGGIVRIGELTSSAIVRLSDLGAEASTPDATAFGVTVLGQPVGLTDQGFTTPTGSEALDPILQSVVAPVSAAGVSVHLTHGTHSAQPGVASATSGQLVVEMKTVVRNSPVQITASFGEASASLAVMESDAASAPAATTVSPVSPGADGAGIPSALSGSPTAPPPPPPALTASSAGVPRDEPARNATEVAFRRLDFRPLYLWMCVGALAVLAGRQWIKRASRGSGWHRRSSLSAIWRW